MFLIIGIWGGQRRVYASFKFFLYTLVGLAVDVARHHGDLLGSRHHRHPDAAHPRLSAEDADLAVVRLPRLVRGEAADVAVHTWLPDAHVEAPTAGSVILAGILPKMGGYGFLRFSIPMFPLASASFAPLIFALSVIAIIYTSLVARAGGRQAHRLFLGRAYGLVTIGVFTLTMQGSARRHLPDAVARHRLRRALPLRRRDLRPHAYLRGRGIGGSPTACRSMPSASWCSRSPMSGYRHVRLRRRVPEPDRAFRINTWSRSSPPPASSCRPRTRSTSIAGSSSADWRRRTSSSSPT
jgi:hypothetical protein